MVLVRINDYIEGIEAEDFPPQAWHTPFFTMAELGTRKHPFEVMNLFGYSLNSLNIAERTISAPCLHTILMTENFNEKGRGKSTFSGVFGPGKTNLELMRKLIYQTQINVGDIKNIFEKVGYINDMVLRSFVTDSNFHFLKIEKRHTTNNGNGLGYDHIKIDYDKLGIILPTLEDYLGVNKVDTATARGFVFAPIGLGNSEARYSSVAKLMGYKGTYVYLPPAETIIKGREPKNALMQTVAQCLRLTNDFSEFGLIKMSYLIDMFERNGVNVQNSSDFLQMVPLLVRWMLYPRLTSFTNSEAMTYWLLQWYVFLRYMSKLREFVTLPFVQEVTWNYTGRSSFPSIEFVESCFRGIYRGEVNGFSGQGIFYFPATSACLRMGELQIMTRNLRLFNNWHPSAEQIDFAVKPEVVWARSRLIKIPPLKKLGYDACVVAYETNVEKAIEEEPLILEARPPVLHIVCESALKSEQSNRKAARLLDSLLYGGDPLYNIDTWMIPLVEQSQLETKASVSEYNTLALRERLEAASRSGKMDEVYKEFARLVLAGGSYDQVLTESLDQIEMNISQATPKTVALKPKPKRGRPPKSAK